MKTNLMWASCFCAVLSFLALFPLPYSFYIILRWILSAVSLALSIHFFKKGKKNILLACTALGILLLFNPIDPFTMDKDNWAVFNTTSAAYFLLSAWLLKKDLAKNKVPQQDLLASVIGRG